MYVLIPGEHLGGGGFCPALLKSCLLLKILLIYVRMYTYVHVFNCHLSYVCKYVPYNPDQSLFSPKVCSVYDQKGTATSNSNHLVGQ